MLSSAEFPNATGSDFYALGLVITVNNSESTFSYNYVHVLFLKKVKKARLYLGKDSQVYLFILLPYGKSMVNTGLFPDQFNESFPWDWLKRIKIIYIGLVQGQVPSEDLLKYSFSISKKFNYLSYYNSPYCDI